jgi:hypothetical protein
MQTLCVLAMVAACGAGTALAAIEPGGEQREFVGLGEDLIDGSASGPGVNIFTVVVPPSEFGADNVTGFKDFFININHTWVGDLVITFSHADAEGDVVTLLDRPGVPATTNGNSDNLFGMYRFFDSGALSFPETSAGAGATVPAGLYNRSGPGSFADFNDGTAIGTWVLQVQDFAEFDTGAVVSWGFTINTIPTAPAVVVFAAAGLAGLRRRR